MLWWSAVSCWLVSVISRPCILRNRANTLNAVNHGLMQQIWDEVGESDEERDKMLLQLEQECLDVYKRKVDQAVKSRAHLLQALADAQLELSRLLSALGEKSFVGIPDKTSGTIKEQLAAIAPTLEQLWKQKEERVKEFSDVQTQIQKICGEIAGNSNLSEVPVVDEADLSLKKLDEFQGQLQELQKEKSDRLHKVLEFVSTVHDLCAVLGMDFFNTVTEVHPSLNDQLLQELATQLIDLWNLMDTPEEERSLFDHVTCNISASVDEVTIPGALALDLIEQAEVEVERLDQLKASRMKEIAFKRQAELEEIFARAHIEIDPEAARAKIMSLIDSGMLSLLTQLDIALPKQDENRYNSSRGAHLNLKRAEKARILVNKIPALVDTLVAKTGAWEEDHGIPFTYDGVPLLAMLDEYAMLRHDREEEKRRMRVRLTRLLCEGSHFWFAASPGRPLGPKKVVGPRANGGANGTPSRRLSLNANQNGARSTSKDGKRDNTRPVAPVNYVAISKEDAASHVSGTEPVPASP
ncbi:65-kDa microtubule-associated protein 1 [Vitis vinifera]|uniref:65-kDa microtubule-associated protein 1 n=1 Tax=Vitis vinifera TaxID=29760 RepID=A0A438H6D7_VITVI|nr:65-kDa microtubule-associated protein 1 [Vitis vinifera]